MVNDHINGGLNSGHFMKRYLHCDQRKRPFGYRLIRFSDPEVFIAGPIAERSKSSDLDCGRGDPGSNPAWGHFFRCWMAD